MTDLPTLHIIGLPHTRTTDQFSHCAFTGKVRRMGPMMRSVGYVTVHYGVGSSRSGSNIDVQLLTDEEQVDLLGFDPQSPDYHYAFNNVDVRSKLYTTFNDLLTRRLRANVKDGDLVLHTFGNGSACVHGQHTGIDVESGIGYDEPWARWRIYESFAKMHYVLGKERSNPSYFNWVIPNYYDPQEWTVRQDHGEYALFMGRITDMKGVYHVMQLASIRPDVNFIVCGQGKFDGYVPKNVEIIPPVHGKDRDVLLGKALCVLAPSKYVEPFGGVVVEGMMTGTPALVPPWGAFMETVQHRFNGFHCRMLQDWSAALDAVRKIDRTKVANKARTTYSMFRVAHLYDVAFRAISAVNADRGTKEHADWTSIPAWI